MSRGFELAAAHVGPGQPYVHTRFAKTAEALIEGQGRHAGVVVGRTHRFVHCPNAEQAALGIVPGQEPAHGGPHLLPDLTPLVCLPKLKELSEIAQAKRQDVVKFGHRPKGMPPPAKPLQTRWVGQPPHNMKHIVQCDLHLGQVPDEQLQLVAIHQVGYVQVFPHAQDIVEVARCVVWVALPAAKVLSKADCVDGSVGRSRDDVERQASVLARGQDAYFVSTFSPSPGENQGTLCGRCHGDHVLAPFLPILVMPLLVRRPFVCIINRRGMAVKRPLPVLQNRPTDPPPYRPCCGRGGDAPTGLGQKKGPGFGQQPGPHASREPPYPPARSLLPGSYLAVVVVAGRLGGVNLYALELLRPRVLRR